MLKMTLDFMHRAGGLICSQVHPLEGSMLPLCARCSGIYITFGLALLATWAARRVRPVSAPKLWLALLFIAVAPAHALAAPISAPDWTRFLAGASAGAGLAMLVGAGASMSVASAFVLTAIVLLRSTFVYALLAVATPFAIIAAVAAPVAVIARSINRPMLSCGNKS